MSDFKEKLIKIGEEKPELQKHLRSVLNHIKSQKTSEKKESVFRENMLYNVVDRKEIKNLQQEFDRKGKDILMEIIMEFNKKLSPDDETQRALNRFRNVLESNTSSENKVNQLRKVGKDLGLGYY